ncbi:hypothetical protein VPH35_073875 [Triticum aestivum]
MKQSILHLESILHRLNLILEMKQSIPMQRLKVIVKMKQSILCVQGHIIFKGFLLIQGRGFLFQSMMSMIKMKFGDDTLQSKQSNHMHTTFKSGKSMVKIDTSTLFGLRPTNG